MLLCFQARKTPQRQESSPVYRPPRNHLPPWWPRQGLPPVLLRDCPKDCDFSCLIWLGGKLLRHLHLCPGFTRAPPRVTLPCRAPSHPLACLPMALDTARVPLTLQQSMCDTKPPRASMRSFSSCGDSQGGRGAGGRAVGLGVPTLPEGRPAGFQGSAGDRVAVRRD